MLTRLAVAVALAFATLVLASVAGAAKPPAPHAPAPKAACADADLDPSPQNLERVREAVRCLANQERSKRGLGALTADATLRRAGQARVRDMLTSDWYGHVSPGGETATALLSRFGYARGRFVVGENLHWGEQRLASPAQTIRHWLKSKLHRRNMLRPSFREMGIGAIAGIPRAATGGRLTHDGWTYVTEFGARSR